MFCPYCGNPCADTHKYCFRCGEALPERIDDEAAPVAPVPDENTPESFPPPAMLPEPEVAVTDLPEPNPMAVPDICPTEPETVTPPPRKGRLWPPILVLCLMMCVGLAAFFLGPGTPAPAKSCFTVENGILFFDESLYSGSEELTVPEMVDGMAVTGISENCFADCDNLTTIILPKTVTVIGDHAFAGCDALRGIYIPNGVLSIGAGAMAQCPSLEAVYLPGSLSEIGEGCLDDCDGLQYILFDGTYAQWRDLYSGIFQNQVELHTKDGVYRAQP